MFFIAFTGTYVCGPMIMNKEVNYWMLAAFLFYLFFDFGIRYKEKCLGELKNALPYALLNALIGVAAAAIALTVMYSAKLYKYLFFNETSSTKDMCSMPSKQTFKCSVYKNGELVGSSTA
jgi:hypothetical protein